MRNFIKTLIIVVAFVEDTALTLIGAYLLHTAFVTLGADMYIALAIAGAVELILFVCVVICFKKLVKRIRNRRCCCC